MYQIQDAHLLRQECCTPLEMLPGHEPPECDRCDVMSAQQLVRGLSDGHTLGPRARQLLCDSCTDATVSHSSDGGDQ
jgi:hypothetical protein